MIRRRPSVGEGTWGGLLGRLNQSSQRVKRRSTGEGPSRIGQATWAFAREHTSSPVVAAIASSLKALLAVPSQAVALAPTPTNTHMSGRRCGLCRWWTSNPPCEQDFSGVHKRLACISHLQTAAPLFYFRPFHCSSTLLAGTIPPPTSSCPRLYSLLLPLLLLPPPPIHHTHLYLHSESPAILLCRLPCLEQNLHPSVPQPSRPTASRKPSRSFSPRISLYVCRIPWR